MRSLLYCVPAPLNAALYVEGIMSFFERHSNVIQWISGLGLPIAIVISSWFVSTSVEKTKVDSDYVRLAVGILSNDLADDENKISAFSGISRERKAMRQWAIRVLDAKSPVKFTEDEKKAFVATGIDTSVLFSTMSSDSQLLKRFREKLMEDRNKNGVAEDSKESVNNGNNK